MTRGWQYSLEALEPAVFRRYLRARGWKESTTPGEAMHRYALDVENRQVQVEIPTVSTFADYERRIGEAMEIIAAVESRTPLDVLANLRRPQSDVVRFRIDGQETSGGTIGLDDAIRLREGRKRMLLAMAHSVVEPLPHFARLTRTDPVEFVNSCREAPARAGSYVSEVFVPVAPSMGSLGLDDPFARKVTTKLARALGRTASALNAGNDEELLHGAADGLSSNFLAALASLLLLEACSRSVSNGQEAARRPTFPSARRASPPTCSPRWRKQLAFSATKPRFLGMSSRGTLLRSAETRTTLLLRAKSSLPRPSKIDRVPPRCISRSTAGSTPSQSKRIERPRASGWMEL
jgi:hypothetical protein